MRRCSREWESGDAAMQVLQVHAGRSVPAGYGRGVLLDDFAMRSLFEPAVHHCRRFGAQKFSAQKERAGQGRGKADSRRLARFDCAAAERVGDAEEAETEDERTCSVSVEAIRKAFGLAERLRAAADALTFSERRNRITMEVCVCCGCWRDIWLGGVKLRHDADCPVTALLSKADQIEADAIAEQAPSGGAE